jgi:hypothetical protein
VYILDIDEAEMKNVQKQFNDEYCEGAAMYLKCDVTSQEEFESMEHICYKIIHFL